MAEQTNNKTIAKNTLFLYFRMMLTMLISLYTSRVILQKLGVDDYGIYQAVGGVVGFLSFLNGAISTGTSRFLTFELGKNNFDKLRRTFSTLLTTHILIAGIVVIIAETIGLWFVYHKMVIPPERMTAAIYTYHISIITAVITLTQVPYNATIIAHEKMSIYAYLSIYEVVAKLAVCYLIGIGDVDKLIVYATLIFLVHVSLLLFYRIFCVRHYPETKYKFGLEKEILKPVLSFSGWNLFAQSSIALSHQGILVLLNMFFPPTVVTARSISLQVNSVANHFVQNFRTAVNPQIIKQYAVENYQGSKSLLLQSTKFSFYLMLILALPIFFVADSLLHFWLGDNVPQYTTLFLQIVIIQSLFQVFDSSFYTALYAKGQLKENAIISPVVGFAVFPIIYFLFKAGYSPLALSWAYLIAYALLGLVIKPLLIIKIVDYTWKEIFSVFIPCFFVSLVSAFISFFLNRFFNSSTVSGFLLEVVSIVFVVLIVCYTVGLDKAMRMKINGLVLSKFRRHR